MPHKLTEKTFVDSNGRQVAEGSPFAVRMVGNKGDSISNDDARKYGLLPPLKGAQADQDSADAPTDAPTDAAGRHLTEEQIAEIEAAKTGAPPPMTSIPDAALSMALKSGAPASTELTTDADDNAGNGDDGK